MKQKGFTILELLVVIAIIGILAAIYSYGFQGNIKNTKEGVARNHLLNIYLAQEEYMADNQQYYSGGSSCSNQSKDIDAALFNETKVLEDFTDFYFCIKGSNNNTEYTACAVNTLNPTVKFFRNQKNESGIGCPF